MSTNNQLSPYAATPDTGVLANVSMASPSDMVEVARKSGSRLGKLAQARGYSDTPFHAGNQLSTNDVVGHILTIEHVAYANVPAVDNDGNPVYMVDANGVAILDDAGDPIQARKQFPVMTFHEAPGYWLNCGQIASAMIADWAADVGDDPTVDPMLPNLNQELEECGGVAINFQWKDGKNRRYVKVIVA